MSVGLIASIIIRLLALGWSLVLLKRTRDWRMGFLSIMLALMALRQILTLGAGGYSTDLSLSALATEWPGLIVSLMAFLWVYFLGRILDERKQVANRQAKLIADLEEQNAELERFSYTISHDLKTPLVTIAGFIGYMKRDLENNDIQSLKADLEKIEGAATKFARLLDDLLELSRVGRVELPPERIALDQAVEAALKQLEAQIDNAAVEIIIDPDLPQLNYEPTRLIELLVILLDNAIKFMGDQTHPQIHIGCRRDGLETSCFVKDNGIGMKPSHQQQIFGLFDRLDPSLPGSGIGLAIAWRIVESNAGRIWVESSGEGCGSCFLFTLPLAPASDPA